MLNDWQSFYQVFWRGKKNVTKKSIYMLYIKYFHQEDFFLKMEKINPQGNFNSIIKKTFYLVLNFGNNGSSN